MAKWRSAVSERADIPLMSPIFSSELPASVAPTSRDAPNRNFFLPKRLQDGGRDEVKGIDQESGRDRHILCVSELVVGFFRAESVRIVLVVFLRFFLPEAGSTGHQRGRG